MFGAAAVVGLAAAQPLLTSAARLPWAADTLIHLYRLVELDHLLQHGYWFPRYAPDLAYGFGFPLFNFYAPLSYYLAEVFRLVGMDFSPALLATFGLLIVLAGLGMYGWARELWGQRGGVVAAAAYVTAPYLLYNVYHRGALAEVLAMTLMPALLWAMARRSFLLTALLYVALLLGHNITALVFTPVIVIYAGLLLTHASEIRDTQYVFRIPYSVIRVALSLLLGLGLSAFFWAPAFFERDSVQIFQLFLPEGFDYHFNFVMLGELLAPPAAVDPNLVLQPTSRSVGLIPVVLAVLAVVMGWRRWDVRQRRVAGFAAVLVMVSLFLTLPQSVAIWDALPLLRFVQFPWRFLSFASLGLAFLAGGAFADFSPQTRQDTQCFELKAQRVLASGWFIGLLIAGMIVYGFTWQYVPFLAPISRPTVTDIARYERESGALGTTSAGDYLPNTVKKLPDANMLSERYSHSDVIERLEPASLPAGAKIIQAAYRPLSADVTIDSPAPFVAVLDIFDFAGWQAKVDGLPVNITPTDPHGLISLPVPAGRHRAQVYFGSTPLRTAAEVVSFLSLIVLVGSTFALSFDRKRLTADDGRQVAVSGRQSAVASPAVVCILAIGLMACKTLYLDNHETLFRKTRFDGTRVMGVAHSLNVNFDNQMALMGYEPQSLVTDASAGSPLRVTLYWHAMRKLDVDYSISVQLVDERGYVYGQRDSQHPGGYPTSRWTSNDYARDVHDIPLAPSMPPGEYRVRVGVYQVGAPSGLSVLGANGAPSGTTFDLAAVTVNRPSSLVLLRPKPVMPKLEHPSGATLAPGLVLLGYDLPQTEVNVGEKLYFTLYWQAQSAQSRDLKACLQLADSNGVLVFSTDVAPISPQFPVSRLQNGDVVRGPNSIRIPASTRGGTFVLKLALVDGSSAAMGDVAELGRVTVRVPQRMMDPPPVHYPMQADLGRQIRLIGYDVSPLTLKAPSQVRVVLYWQALREMVSDYKSFVHVLDPTGRLVAGSDLVPANWTRPTTGWIAGEYVTDPHTLVLPDDLPPGEYRLEVGLYDAESNLRLGQSILLNQSISVGEK